MRSHSIDRLSAPRRIGHLQAMRRRFDRRKPRFLEDLAPACHLAVQHRPHQLRLRTRTRADGDGQRRRAAEQPLGILEGIVAAADDQHALAAALVEIGKRVGAEHDRTLRQALEAFDVGEHLRAAITGTGSDDDASGFDAPGCRRQPEVERKTLRRLRQSVQHRRHLDVHIQRSNVLDIAVGKFRPHEPGKTEHPVVG